MVTPTARRLQLPSSSSSSAVTIRPILTSSNSSSNLPTQSILSTRKRSGSTSSTPSGLAAPSSMFSKSLPPSSGIHAGFRSSKSVSSSPTDPHSQTQNHAQVSMPHRPAPASAYITPSSVEYAQSRSLHPLTSASRTSRLPFSGSSSSSSVSPSETFRPRGTTLHPLSHTSYQLTASTSNPIGLKGSLVSKLAPRKGYPIVQGGIGAGGVSRV